MCLVYSAPPPSLGGATISSRWLLDPNERHSHFPCNFWSSYEGLGEGE